MAEHYLPMMNAISQHAANPMLLFSMPSGGEWMWLVLIVFILFGAKKIPELAKGLGQGIRNFNDAKTAKDEATPSPAPAAEAPSTIRP